jgi:hypothetical protein
MCDICILFLKLPYFVKNFNIVEGNVDFLWSQKNFYYHKKFFTTTKNFYKKKTIILCFIHSKLYLKI